MHRSSTWPEDSRLTAPDISGARVVADLITNVDHSPSTFPLASATSLHGQACPKNTRDDETSGTCASAGHLYRMALGRVPIRLVCEDDGDGDGHDEDADGAHGRHRGSVTTGGTSFTRVSGGTRGRALDQGDFADDQRRGRLPLGDNDLDGVEALHLSGRQRQHRRLEVGSQAAGIGQRGALPGPTDARGVVRGPQRVDDDVRQGAGRPRHLERVHVLLGDVRARHVHVGVPRHLASAIRLYHETVLALDADRLRRPVFARQLAQRVLRQRLRREVVHDQRPAVGAAPDDQQQRHDSNHAGHFRQ